MVGGRTQKAAAGVWVRKEWGLKGAGEAGAFPGGRRSEQVVRADTVADGQELRARQKLGWKRCGGLQGVSRGGDSCASWTQRYLRH